MVKLLQDYHSGLPQLIVSSLLYSPLWVSVFGVDVTNRRIKMLDFFDCYFKLIKNCSGFKLFSIYEGDYLVGCLIFKNLHDNPNLKDKYTCGFASLSWRMGLQTTVELLKLEKYMDSVMFDSGRSWSLQFMIVHPDYRGSGVGLKALENSIELVNMRLVLACQNKREIEFFRRAGFGVVSSGTNPMGIYVWIMTN